MHRWISQVSADKMALLTFALAKCSKTVPWRAKTHAFFFFLNKVFFFLFLSPGTKKKNNIKTKKNVSISAGLQPSISQSVHPLLRGQSTCRGENLANYFCFTPDKKSVDEKRWCHRIQPFTDSSLPVCAQEKVHLQSAPVMTLAQRCKADLKRKRQHFTAQDEVKTLFLKYPNQSQRTIMMYFLTRL